MDIYNYFLEDLLPQAEWNSYGANNGECEALSPDTTLRSHGQHIDSRSILSPCLEGLEDLGSCFAPRNESDSLGCHPDVLSQTAILPDTHAFKQDGVLWSPVQQLITTPSVDVPFSDGGDPALPTPALITRPVVGTRGIRDASDRRRGPEAAPKWVCHLCSSSFTAKHNLDYHLRAHTDQRPFKCDVCPGATFRTKSDLRRHITKSQKHALYRQFARS